MSAKDKQSCSVTLILIGLGLLALYCDPRWLMLLVPAALIVWFVRTGTIFENRR